METTTIQRATLVRTLTNAFCPDNHANHASERCHDVSHAKAAKHTLSSQTRWRVGSPWMTLTDCHGFPHLLTCWSSTFVKRQCALWPVPAWRHDTEKYSLENQEGPRMQTISLLWATKSQKSCCKVGCGLSFNELYHWLRHRVICLLRFGLCRYCFNHPEKNWSVVWLKGPWREGTSCLAPF